MELNAIDTVTAVWVDRDIADGVLRPEQRDERIARRRERYSIGVVRNTMPGTLGPIGIATWPSTILTVYLQYGYTPVTDEDAMPDVTLEYRRRVASDEPLDDDDLAFVRDSIRALRTDCAVDLPIDIKPSVLRFDLRGEKHDVME